MWDCSGVILLKTALLYFSVALAADRVESDFRIEPDRCSRPWFVSDETRCVALAAAYSRGRNDAALDTFELKPGVHDQNLVARVAMRAPDRHAQSTHALQIFRGGFDGRRHLLTSLRT